MKIDITGKQQQVLSNQTLLNNSMLGLLQSQKTLLDYQQSQTNTAK
jgi:hypothetical protein